MDSNGYHTGGVGSGAVSSHTEGVVSVRSESCSGVCGAGDARGHNAGVAHVVHRVGGTGVVGIGPVEGYAIVGSRSCEASDGQTLGHGGYNEGVVLCHAPAVCSAGVGIGCSCNRARVGVEVAVGTDNTHSVVAESLGGRDVKGGSQRGGVGAGTHTGIDNLVALKN